MTGDPGARPYGLAVRRVRAGYQCGWRRRCQCRSATAQQPGADQRQQGGRAARATCRTGDPAPMLLVLAGRETAAGTVLGAVSAGAAECDGACVGTGPTARAWTAARGAGVGW